MDGLLIDSCDDSDWQAVKKFEKLLTVGLLRSPKNLKGQLGTLKHHAYQGPGFYLNATGMGNSLPDKATHLVFELL